MKAKFTVSFEVEIEFDPTDMTTKQAVSEITESMHFPCEDTDNVVITQQSIMGVTKGPIRVPKYEIGDEVKWNDPDDGICSGIYKILDVEDDGMYYIYTIEHQGGNSVTEAFESELS